jgi:hypothetical protein
MRLIEELQIGNWVEQPNTGPQKVTEILNKYQIRTTSGHIDKYCRPIKFTEDWAIDFGFEKDYVGGSYRYSSYRFVFQENGNDKVLVFHTFGDGFVTEFQYVHEVQNFISLMTGKKLTKIEGCDL